MPDLPGSVATRDIHESKSRLYVMERAMLTRSTEKESPMDTLFVQAQRLGMVCREKGLRIATAESCTGGWVAQVLTEIPGSSQWFDAGYVTYSNSAKQHMLGVPAQTLKEFGAVSEETVEAMALGALRQEGANLSVAISGVAGPDGGS